jgi:hypothetical protein
MQIYGANSPFWIIIFTWLQYTSVENNTKMLTKCLSTLVMSLNFGRCGKGWRRNWDWASKMHELYVSMWESFLHSIKVNTLYVSYHLCKWKIHHKSLTTTSRAHLSWKLQPLQLLQTVTMTLTPMRFSNMMERKVQILFRLIVVSELWAWRLSPTLLPWQKLV